MFRALEKELGVAPDLDIEAQRAILLLETPRELDWRRIADTIGDASYTFGGAHLRLRGRLRRSPQGGAEFEFSGTGQVMAISDVPPDLLDKDRETEIAARLEGWMGTPELVMLESR